MRSHTNKLLRFALASSACIIAAACAKTEPVVVASIPNEYRDRHPIVVAPAEQGIDIFVRGAGKLDQRQTLELRAAADDYKLNGQGRMTILTPVGIYGPNRGAGVVRAALASAGVHGVVQSHYRVEGPASDQPVRVTYTKLKARVATKCAQWPADIVGFQGTESWDNKQYYNFGCAYQNALANQVSDPIDLARGRTEDRIDTERRIKVIEMQRTGEDPSTSYRSTGTTINRVVGTN